MPTQHERFASLARKAYYKAVKQAKEDGTWEKGHAKVFEDVITNALAERFTPSFKPLKPEFDERVEEIRLVGTKIDAKKTRDAIQKALEAGEDPEAMKAGWKEYCEVVEKWQKSKQEYILRPPSFFNGLRWMDDRKEWYKWIDPRNTQKPSQEANNSLPEPAGWQLKVCALYPHYEPCECRTRGHGIKRVGGGFETFKSWNSLREIPGKNGGTLQEEIR